MRAYPMTQVSIDQVTQTVVCEFCDTTHALAGEKLGSFGFIVQACRLARRHMGCSTPANRTSREVISRELVTPMESEAEFTQKDLENRTGNVVSISVRPHRRGAASDSDPLCLHCGINHTYSVIRICGECQQKHGAQTCVRIVKEREREVAFAAGAGGVQ